jgi:uncharacterized repeat protein (TIGR04138 family)
MSRTQDDSPATDIRMQPELIEIADKDGRYPSEAFGFVMESIRHAQRMFDKDGSGDGEKAGAEHHVSVRELLEGMCDLARREFGLMAQVVFERWGVLQTDDFGEIVFALIDAGALFRTDADRKEDFHHVFDLEPALIDGYRILDESESGWGR